MLRHEARPGRLIAGLVAMATAVLYAGDAAGAWHTAWFAALPLLCGGLLVAAVVGATVQSARRRRAHSASSENTGAPTSTSGSQAIK